MHECRSEDLQGPSQLHHCLPWIRIIMKVVKKLFKILGSLVHFQPRTGKVYKLTSYSGFRVPLHYTAKRCLLTDVCASYVFIIEIVVHFSCLGCFFPLKNVT